MFNSTVLEVAIGLVFCYASVALISSSIYEAFASLLSLRSKTLLQGVKNLLNAHNTEGNDLLLKIYNHALVNPTGSGIAASLDNLKSIPSYLPSRNFAVALIDAIQSAPNDFAQLGADIDALRDPQIKQLLRGMYDRAAGNAEHFHAELATWFDASMERVSGSYKRQSQIWCFVIALLFAALFNIDSIHLFSTLWKHPALVAQISMPASTPLPADTLAQLKQLPIGWQSSLEPTAIIGWLITATAALFGAPFWFDLLQQLIRIRGTGKKPNTFAASPGTPRSTSTPAPAIPATERNAIVDLHAERNKDDPSYRPVQPGERWQ